MFKRILARLIFGGAHIDSFTKRHNWSITVDLHVLKYCIVAKFLKNQSRFSETLVARHSLPHHKISGELKICNSFWIYPPSWTRLLVAMYDDIEKTSILHGELIFKENVASTKLKDVIWWKKYNFR